MCAPDRDTISQFETKSPYFCSRCSAAGFAVAASASAADTPTLPKGKYKPGRIPNEYSLFLPREREALAKPPSVASIDESGVSATLSSQSKQLKRGDAIDGWHLLAVADMNGTAMAIFEKHVTDQGDSRLRDKSRRRHRRIPKTIGNLSKIRPRPINTPHGVRLTRGSHYVPGPDEAGQYILNSSRVSLTSRTSPHWGKNTSGGRWSPISKPAAALAFP